MDLPKAMVDGMNDELIDFLLVQNTSKLMLEKLEKKRNDGKRDWAHPNLCDNKRLIIMLKEHIDKGDMIDVINLAAMINARKSMYGESTIDPPIEPSECDHEWQLGFLMGAVCLKCGEREDSDHYCDVG